MGRGEIQVPLARRGQEYLDARNGRWTIRAIRPLGGAGRGYDVLEIEVRAAGQAGTRLMLSGREFFALAANGFLKPLA